MNKKAINKILTLFKVILFMPYYNYRWHQFNKYSFHKNNVLLVTTILKTQAIQSSSTGISGKDNPDAKLIVSLTSFGRRIHNVFLTIESLFQQSIKADKIILWLSETEFSRDNIPEMLKKAEKRGLTIEFCKDIGSYTKLIHTLAKYPDDLIITVDDDILYPFDMIERLIVAYREHPDVIHCHRAHKIGFSKNGRLKSYNNWNYCIDDPEPSLRIFPTGVAGILYFPGCFHEDILNEKLFLKLAPYSDDVWFKAMSLLRNVKCNIIQAQDNSVNKLMVIEGSQVNSLWSRNKDPRNGNNAQIKAVFNHYKELNNIIRKREKLTS